MATAAIGGASIATRRALLLCAVLVALLDAYCCWRTDYKPRVFGDRIRRTKLVTTHREVQRKIVTYHNFFRSQVSPPASNMLRMSWHKGAARAAQRWAEKCQLLTHDGVTGRWVRNFGSCGQNIFISTQQVPWMFAIRMWYEERHNFTYGSHNNNIYVVGHYTQMVWDATHKVGCGFHRCEGGGGGGSGRRKPYYSYICKSTVTRAVTAATTARCVTSAPTRVPPRTCGPTATSSTPRGTNGCAAPRRAKAESATSTAKPRATAMGRSSSAACSNSAGGARVLALGRTARIRWLVSSLDIAYWLRGAESTDVLASFKHLITLPTRSHGISIYCQPQRVKLPAFNCPLPSERVGTPFSSGC